MRVLLVVDSSTGYLGAPDVDQNGGSSAFAAKWMAKWLESTGYARNKVQSDAEQSIEHLLKAVKSICTADLSVWLLNRYQPHKGGATSFERLTRSPVGHDGGVFDTIRSKTWRSSRGCERNATNISINVGWSHRGK